MKRHLFWRLTQTPYKTNASFPEILVAGTELARRDFSWFDGPDVGRAHVTIHCASVALVETGDVAKDNLVHSGIRAQMRAPERIRGSSSFAVARAS